MADGRYIPDNCSRMMPLRSMQRDDAKSAFDHGRLCPALCRPGERSAVAMTLAALGPYTVRDKSARPSAHLYACPKWPNLGSSGKMPSTSERILRDGDRMYAMRRKAGAAGNPGRGPGQRRLLLSGLFAGERE